MKKQQTNKQANKNNKQNKNKQSKNKNKQTKIEKHACVNVQLHVPGDLKSADLKNATTATSLAKLAF